MSKPTMHCQHELEDDLNYKGFLPDHIVMKWFRDYYSTSKHLLSLYSIIVGLNAKRVLEVGFGRSTFVLAKALSETNGHLVSCDLKDFSYLLNDDEKEITTFILGKAELARKAIGNEGIDFAFLDYFSSEQLNYGFVKNEIIDTLKHLKQNGIVAIHDSVVKKYVLHKVLRFFSPGIFNKKYEVLSLPYNYGLVLIRKLDSSPYGRLDDTFIKKIEGKKAN